jgi:L-histidine N-alpha-methyltransferase
VTVEVLLTSAEMEESLHRDALEGLSQRPRSIPPTWLYDARGSELFSAITRLPEYYLTRREREILGARAPAIAELSGADTLVELGSGTSEKTRLLLDALSASGQLRRFVALDVSEECLRESLAVIAGDYPGVEVRGVVGDFHLHLNRLPRGGRRLVAFLGSTIGNLPPTARAGFLAELGAALDPGDAFLLGTDLVKDRDRLVAAYDDADQVTAEFNRNVLNVLNRELDGDFDPEQFEHVARYDDLNGWVDIALRSRRAQTVRLRALELEMSFEEGEELSTEISAKFTPEGVEAELGKAGLELARWWTDVAGDFGLSLSFKPDDR